MQKVIFQIEVVTARNFIQIVTMHSVMLKKKDTDHITSEENSVLKNWKKVKKSIYCVSPIYLP